MPAKGRWFITPHAIAQYRSRACPGLGYEDALADLVQASQTAHFVRPAHDGCELWRGGLPLRLRFVVAPPKSPGKLPVLVTVLRGCDRRLGC